MTDAREPSAPHRHAGPFGRISPHTVRLVAGKELLEALRDRRTLFVALILPVLLYPLVMLGVGPLVNLQKQRLQQTVQPIAVTGDGAAALVELVLAPLDTLVPEVGPPTDDPEKPVEITNGSGLSVMLVDDPAQALADGTVALWIEASADFEAAVRSEQTGRLTVHRDSSEDVSNAAYQKWREALLRAEQRILDQRLVARDLDTGFRDPIEPDELDVATPERRGAYVLGKMLALILVVMTLSSSFYPAVDVIAGEKERGTMETLLVAPCGRAELVLGKFVAVLVVTLAAALLNLVSMGLTMGPLMSSLDIAGLTGLSVSGLAAVGILALLVPLSALFSALSLSLSTLARSVKEAQHYLTPMFLLVMPLAMVVVIPNIPLTPTLAAVPITNVVLFFRDLLLGKLEILTTLITIGSTAVFAALALFVSVTLFLREETLFRGPEGTGSLLSRPAPRRVPSASAAVFLFAASLAMMWYAQPLLPAEDLIKAAVTVQFALLLAPCLLLAWWLRVRPAATFSLRLPSPAALLLAIPIGLTLPIANSALQRALFGSELEPGAFKELGERFEATISGSSPILLALVLAVLPATVEELFFRGFALSALRGAFRGKGAVLRAVLVTSALFALFHIYPEKWIATGSVGLVLALVAVRTGSIWPCIIVHALNNGSLVLYARLQKDWTLLAPLYEEDDRSHGIAVLGACVLLAASLAALVLYFRDRDAPHGVDEPGTDDPGTDQPGTDDPGTDQPGADDPGDRPAPDTREELDGPVSVP